MNMIHRQTLHNSKGHACSLARLQWHGKQCKRTEKAPWGTPCKQLNDKEKYLSHLTWKDSRVWCHIWVTWHIVGYFGDDCTGGWPSQQCVNMEGARQWCYSLKSKIKITVLVGSAYVLFDLMFTPLQHNVMFYYIFAFGWFVHFYVSVCKLGRTERRKWSTAV